MVLRKFNNRHCKSAVAKEVEDCMHSHAALVGVMKELLHGLAGCARLYDAR